MLRRLLLAAMTAGLVLATANARAEERVHRVGVLVQSEVPAWASAWVQGLREHGVFVGQNVQVEYRYYFDRTESIPALAAELAALQPEVMVAAGLLPARAVQAAAPEIPLGLSRNR